MEQVHSKYVSIIHEKVLKSCQLFHTYVKPETLHFSLVIFRPDTGIINLFMQVPWPLRTSSSTDTRWLLFASLTSTIFKHYPSHPPASAFVYLIQTNFSHYNHFSLSGIFSISVYRHTSHSFAINLCNNFCLKDTSHHATQALHLTFLPLPLC